MPSYTGGRRACPVIVDNGQESYPSHFANDDSLRCIPDGHGRRGFACLLSWGADRDLSELAQGLEVLTQEVQRLRSDFEGLWLNASASAGEEETFTLQLLHASDMDGSTGALQNVENFSAILSAFRAQYPDNTLVLSSGDNFIPGPRCYATADPVNDVTLGITGHGRGDIALLNALGGSRLRG